MPKYALFSRRSTGGHNVYHQTWEASTPQEAWFDLITWEDNIEKVERSYSEYYVQLVNDQGYPIYEAGGSINCGIVGPRFSSPIIHMSLHDARKERDRRARFVGEEVPE